MSSREHEARQATLQNAAMALCISTDRNGCCGAEKERERGNEFRQELTEEGKQVTINTNGKQCEGLVIDPEFAKPELGCHAAPSKGCRKLTPYLRTAHAQYYGRPHRQAQ
ncbi:hypothetical protein BaRGS_00001315 [Batillaria attramentaria]|uniref:Uncharacterized protein n=1 Tax=Batillaria attramentaria TaxID=370345 RepID=A0ABD0M5Z8_9CAEN